MPVAAVAAGCVLVTLAALLLSLALCPPIHAALRLPGGLLRATNVRAGLTAGTLPGSADLGLAAFSALDPSHPVAGAWASSPRPSVLVLAWRCAGVALGVASLITNATTGGGLGAAKWWFTWYTNLSFLQLWAAAVLGAVVSGAAVWRDRRGLACSAAAGDPRPPPPPKAATGAASGTPPPTLWSPLRKAHVLGMSVAAPNAVFLSLFYWAALYPADARLRGDPTPYPDSVLKHGATAAWALVDTLLARTPGCSPHFPALAAWAGAYLILLWSLQAGTGRWVYGIFNWAHGPAVVGVYAALPALLALCTLALYGVGAGRERGRRRWVEKDGGAAAAAAVAAV